MPRHTLTVLKTLLALALTGFASLAAAKVVLPPKPYGSLPNGSVVKDGKEWLQCRLNRQAQYCLLL